MSLFKRNGFVLISVLIFIQLIFISLLVFSQRLYTQSKTARALHEEKIKYAMAEKFMSELEANFVNLPKSCFKMPNEHPGNLAQSWQEACSAKLRAFRYYYAIELLAVDPCGVLENGNPSLRAHFYKIMVFLPESLETGHHLQTTYVQFLHTVNSECKNTYYVKPGRHLRRSI